MTMSSIIDKILNRTKDGQAKMKVVDRESERPFILSSLIYISVIVFIGIPMWFSTCSKTRYSLPDLYEFEKNLNQSQLTLHLDVSVVDMSRKSIKKIDDELSHFEDRRTTYMRTNLPSHLATSIDGVDYSIDWRVRRPIHDEVKVFQEHSKKGSYTFDRENPATLQELEQSLTKVHPTTNKFRLFMYLVDELDYASFCDPTKTHTYTISYERFIYLCPSTALSSTNDHNSLVSLIKEAIQEIYYDTVDPQKLNHITKAHIDLLLTLTPESTATDHLLSLVDLSDKIHHIFKKNVIDIFPELKEIVNVRLITQQIVDIVDEAVIGKIIQRPPKPASTNNNETSKNSSTVKSFRTLKINQIGDLFYRFESRLSKHSSQNVHNVLTLIPNPDDLPLSFGTKNEVLSLLEGQDHNTLLLVDSDKSLVLGLRASVRRLIGLTQVNLCNNCLVRRDVFFNKWELDAIMGSLIMTKLKNTYISLQSISQQVIGIRIPKDVSVTATEAHFLAMKAIENLKTKRILESYRLVSQAFELSEAAYYDPSLLESLYFPDDLKYAIYLPLFLPLALPLLTSVVRVFKFFTSREDKKLKIN